MGEVQDKQILTVYSSDEYYGTDNGNKNVDNKIKKRYIH